MGALLKALLKLLRSARTKPKPKPELPPAKPKPKPKPRPTKPGDPGTPLEKVPANAEVRKLKPDPKGGAQEGVEYKWVNEQGQTVRVRVHGPDGTAPPGSNAATGPIYRVQVGGRYQGPDGTLHPRGVHNPASPNYDPKAANDTHIPWPRDLPLPWE